MRAKRKETDPFYSTAAWKRLRAVVLERDRWQCVWCRRERRYIRDGAGRLIVPPATIVHHIVPLQTDRTLALEDSNLVSLCDYCHDKAHPEKHARAGQGERNPIPEIARSIRVERL